MQLKRLKKHQGDGPGEGIGAPCDITKGFFPQRLVFWTHLLRSAREQSQVPNFHRLRLRDT